MHDPSADLRLGEHHQLLCIDAHITSVSHREPPPTWWARARGSSSRAPMRLLGILLLIAALVAGCSTTGADEPTRGAGQEGYPQTGRNLTRIAPGQRKLLPPISGPVLGASRTLSSADYSGKVVVVNVWGSWCAPCRSEAPDLQAASEQTKNAAQFI